MILLYYILLADTVISSKEVWGLNLCTLHVLTVPDSALSGYSSFLLQAKDRLVNWSPNCLEWGVCILVAVCLSRLALQKTGNCVVQAPATLNRLSSWARYLVATLEALKHWPLPSEANASIVACSEFHHQRVNVDIDIDIDIRVPPNFPWPQCITKPIPKKFGRCVKCK